ncbi:MAG: tetratricopeptide repeat protein [Fibrobacteria bacterium]|nr:tetratricopeptide repeat protein [Fibrobacteria bacterium]
MGKRDDAWKHLVEALRRAPDEPDNVANVLDVARSLGREAEAEAILAELRRSLPAPTAASPAEPFCVKGEEMLGAELWREAVQPFLQAIDSDPERSRAWSGLGIACFRDGKAKAATAFFEIALRLDPTDQDAVLNWAEACGRPGDDLESFLVSAGVSPDLAARARAEVSG